MSFPFGIWFANANTLYVCDEGDGASVAARTINGQSNVADDATLAVVGQSLTGTFLISQVTDNANTTVLTVHFSNVTANLGSGANHRCRRR